jgi:ribosomal protein S18 acetylase RimI-like enzyme
VAITARPYETQDDLRRMQSLQQELWRLEGPRVLTHVGDLAWWATMHTGRDEEWERRLWLDGDRCVAWAWFRRPAALDYDLHPDHLRGDLHRELLDWFESVAESDVPRTTFALESEDERIAVLRQRGYARAAGGSSYVYYVSELDGSDAVPELPEGFTLRTVDPVRDLHARVEVHRAAWTNSRVTEESYRNVMRAWPYRCDLDCVVEAPDGSFAASVLCWYDDENRVGELEPVGTHRDHRRRGGAAAACAYALRRLRDEGACRAIVYAGGRVEDEPARSLYETVGFREHSRVIEFRKAA